MIQDNNLQTPLRVRDPGQAAGAGRSRGLYDDTPADESCHMFLLALGNHRGDIPGIPVNTPAGGPASPDIPTIVGERCGNAPSGGIRITGGMALDRIDWWRTYYRLGGAHSSGRAEAHACDQCGATNPPPYFPDHRSVRDGEWGWGIGNGE